MAHCFSNAPPDGVPFHGIHPRLERHAQTEMTAGVRHAENRAPHQAVNFATFEKPEEFAALMEAMKIAQRQRSLAATPDRRRVTFQRHSGSDACVPWRDGS